MCNSSSCADWAPQGSRFGNEIGAVSGGVRPSGSRRVSGRADGAAMTNITLPPATLLLRLSREWAILCHRPTAVRRAAGWGLGVEIGSLDDVLIACGMARSAAERNSQRASD